MPEAILLIDHGSHRKAAHDQLLDLAGRLQTFLKQRGSDSIVEIAHMDIMSPTISEGLARCIERGADLVSTVPCFLSRGRHVTEDIPGLLREAAGRFPGVRVIYAAPLLEQAGFLQVILSAAASASEQIAP